MRPCIQQTMWLSALIALMTASLPNVYAQNPDKPPAKAGGAMQGDLHQMGGQAGMT